MAWEVTDTRGARARFISEWLVRKWTTFASLCRGHRISRSCGYKWIRRFEECGRGGLKERSRRPKQAAQLQARWQQRLRLALLQERDFGPKKLRWKLRCDYPRQRVPCVRTLARWLKGMGRVRACVRRARPGPLIRLAGRLVARCCNDVWSLDLKGSFRTQDGRWVFALTARDVASRYILCVRHVRRADERHIGRVLRWLFRRYGLPRAIRMDNGSPFGAGGPRGWSRLSVQWIKLGIRTEYGRPRHPEDNPAHEQMHRVLKQATAKPASRNLAAQQRRFERWRKRYNERRPHEAARMQPPCLRYRKSPRPLPGDRVPWTYPHAWLLLRPDAKGRCVWAHRQRLIGQAFVGETLGAKPIKAGVLAVYYRQHLIGTLHATDLAGLRPVHPLSSH